MRLEKDWVFDGGLAESPLPATREGSPSVRIDMSIYSDDESFSGDEFLTVSAAETDEGRLSRSLQTWMPEHEWTTVEPLERPPLEPVFSGRLGRERMTLPKVKPMKSKRSKGHLNIKSKPSRPKTAPLRRANSNDSIVTSLSLLTCSSKGDDVEELKLADPKRRRRRRVGSRCSTTTTATTTEEPKESIWVAFAQKKTGALKRMMRAQVTLIVTGVDEFDHESEAFRMLEPDVQESLYECGRSRGIRFINRRTLKRSSSCGSIKDVVLGHRRNVTSRSRALSVCSKHPWGKFVDVGEFKREQMRRRVALEQARLEKEKSRRLRRHSYRRTPSGSNILADNVPDGGQSQTVTSLSERFSDSLSNSSSQSRSGKEEKISVWKGDREILEIDLKRELTMRVQNRIDTTRTALKRVTGMGDSNAHRVIIGKYDEFPKHTEEDFSHRPRIVQKMRISPHLSGVIHNDIQVRMGRPRYHEIRTTDMVQWNKGHDLDRAHRNLKVFNWLHSIRESEFEGNVAPEIYDEIPDEEASQNLELLHVESADEPDAKPMFRQYEVRIL